MNNKNNNTTFSNTRAAASYKKKLEKREKERKEQEAQERIQKEKKEKLENEINKKSYIENKNEKDNQDLKKNEQTIVKKKKIIIKKKVVKAKTYLDTNKNSSSKNEKEKSEKSDMVKKSQKIIDISGKSKVEGDKIQSNVAFSGTEIKPKVETKRTIKQNIQNSKPVNLSNNPNIDINKNNFNYKNMGVGNEKTEKEQQQQKKELERVKLENSELKILLEKLQNEMKNDNIYNPDYRYDIALKIDSLKDLRQGWEIKYNIDTQKNYSSFKNQNMLTIGLLGMKNVGKSFVVSKILNEKAPDKKETNFLFLRYITKPKTDFNLAIIDPPGFGRALKREEIFSNNIENDLSKQIDIYEKNDIQTDNFLLNFILKKSNFLIVVVGSLNIYEQKMLLKLKSKDEEHKEAYKELKRIFVIHNLKEMSKIEEIKDHISKIILKSMTFNLDEKETQLTQKKIDKSKNSKYFIEKNDNKEIEIYHLILAKDNTEAGKYYNEFVYSLINQQFNYFHGINSFDLITEIKKEIINNSETIFIKPLKTLDDFENIKDKIKVKNNFEIISNLEENSDFSFLRLKPRYSYYKIDKDTKLLVIIEMPGNIINRKLVCSAPKNGFYSMKFSGKKVLNFPENLEMEKKKGLFFNNREEGDFKETFKIKQENFSLSSYNYIKEENENNGVYKYYFPLIKNNSSDDED